MDTMKQPIPNGFEGYKTEDGLFIRNIQDGKEFKWIPISELEANGIDRNGNLSQYGRRSFDGPFNDLDGETYKDVESKPFEETAQKHKGFYISVEKFKKCYKDEAEQAAKKYLKDSTDAKSALPSGGAYDCLFEYIYERFRKYVLDNQNEDESPYDAWNRIAEAEEDKHKKDGVYGIKNLMNKVEEHTSELGGGWDSCAYRTVGYMQLFNGWNENEKIIDPKHVRWGLGLRNFCYFRFAEMGYRIMILPN